jgi:DNA-binding beta-propeller fold protein YncE
MASGVGIRLSFSARAALRNVLRLIPAVVIIAATLNTLSCSNPGGFLSAGANSNVSPTSTPTTSTGALAFVTNYNDGKVSSFTRNITTGALKRTGEAIAGAKQGPKGLVAAPSGGFLYVANNADDNIYQFSVNSTDGTLTPLSPAFVSNGKGSGPDEIAINTAGSFLWVTGAKNRTVTAYSINSSTGQIAQIAKNSQVTVLGSPFGIAVDSANGFVYVADTGAGLVYSYSIDASGALTQIGLPVPDLGSPGGSPGFISIDPAATFIYVTDLKEGQLAVLGTAAGALTFGSVVPGTTTGFKPVGIGYATTSSGNFVFTANQNDSTIWSFLLALPGSPSPPAAFGSGDLNAPTGLVVDPQNAFVYTTNQNAGTVSQFSLSSSCLGVGAPCFVRSVAVESSGSKSGPFGITLAQ